MRTIILIIIHCSATPEGKSLSAEACRLDHILHRGFRDIGYHFPDTAGEFKNIDSKILLKKTIELIATKGYSVSNIDATVCAERPKLKAHIPEMQRTLATVMGIDEDDISIKATTTEKLGFTGREEGISAYATVLIVKE